jgi:hypothetical protein
VVLVGCGVIGNVRLGIKEQEALLQRFDELALQMGEPDADFDKLLEEQAELQVSESKDHTQGIELTRCDGHTDNGTCGFSIATVYVK